MAGFDYGGLPPELQLQAEQLARRQKIADMLAQQSVSPTAMPQGGRIASRMSPLQPMTQLLTAALSNKANRDNAESSLDLGNRYNSLMQEGVQDYMRRRNGTGVAPDPQELSQSADYGTPPPPAAGPGTNPRELAMTALLSRNPKLQALGKMDLEHENKLDEPLVVPPGGTLSTRRGKELMKQPPLHQIPTTWEQDLPAGSKRLPTDPAGVFRMAGAGGIEDVYQIEYEGGVKKGYKKLDKTTNRDMSGGGNQNATSIIVDPKNPARQIVVKIGEYDEKKYLAGDNTGVVGESGKLSETQRATAKRQIAMQGVGEAITEARNILNGAGGQEKPTGSGIGAAVDKTAGFFGATPAGAKAADRLEVVGGSLVSKVPRFEGPQSNYDVDYYKSVAGRIGDRSIPLDRRLAALDEVERVWAEFEGGKKHGFFQLKGPNDAGASNAPPPPPPGFKPLT